MSTMTPEATDSSGVPGASARQIRLVPPRRARRSAWLVLRQPGFRLYFLGTLTSNLGTWFQSTGQIIIAFQITHSVFIVGLITSAQFAGMVFSPWAAVLADRIGTKTYLVSTQVASAGIALWMAWRYHSGLLGVHTLVFGALGLGLAYALALPVQTALVPALVDPADTTEAVRMNAVSYNVGRALAPALYVLVIGFLRPDLIFVFNAASFIVFACCLARVLGRLNHTSRQEHDRRDRGKEPDRYARPHVTDGFRTALRHRRILLLLAIIGAVTFAEDPIFVLSPTLTHTALQVSTHWTGYFIAALGWGCVVGSLPPTSKKDNARQPPGMPRLGWCCSDFSHRLHVGNLSRDQPASVFCGWCRWLVYGNGRSDGSLGASEEEGGCQRGERRRAMGHRLGGHQAVCILAGRRARHSYRPRTHRRRACPSRAHHRVWGNRPLASPENQNQRLSGSADLASPLACPRLPPSRSLRRISPLRRAVKVGVTSVTDEIHVMHYD